MTANIELLPLPKWCYADKHLHVGSAAIRKEMRAYTRANAAHATEPLIAEIERLRAEREVIGAEAVKYADKSGRLEARAERLAEALRKIAALKEREADELGDAIGIANEALEQEGEK